MKATSKVAIYHSNPEKMAGAVHLVAGEVTCFPRETVIQPDNLYPVPHADLSAGSVVGELPEDCRQRLEEAITRSVSLTEIRRTRLLREIQTKAN
jgi:hypothetical protein